MEQALVLLAITRTRTRMCVCRPFQFCSFCSTGTVLYMTLLFPIAPLGYYRMVFVRTGLGQLRGGDPTFDIARAPYGSESTGGGIIRRSSGAASADGLSPPDVKNKTRSVWEYSRALRFCGVQEGE